MIHPEKIITAELEPQVFLLEMSHDIMKNNNYLVVDPNTHQAVVIDPAWQKEKIDEALQKTKATLSGILITHSHFDHINLAKPLAEFYNCPIWMSEKEIALSGFSAPQLVAINEIPWYVGKLKIQPIATPGHTPGCICYLIGSNLFSGDVLFAEGCGICPSIHAAHEMFHSLEKLKRILPLATHIFPGHTYVRPPGQKFSDLLQRNMYLQFPDSESFAAYRMRKGQSMEKILNFR